MSRWSLNLEVFKFYKLKSDKFVKIAFVSLLLMRAGLWMLPTDTSDLAQLLTGAAVSSNLSATLSEGLGQMDWLFLGLQLLLQIIVGIISILYAKCFIVETISTKEIASDLPMAVWDDLRRNIHAARLIQTNYRSLEDAVAEYRNESRRGLEHNLESKENTDFPAIVFRQNENPFSYTWRLIYAALPKLILYVVLYNLVRGVSLLFLGIPFLLFLGAFILAPLYMAGGLQFRSSMKLSYEDTYGLKLFVLSKYFFIEIFFSLLDSLFYMFFQDYFYSLMLVASLLATLHTFVFGRFMGIMHFLCARIPRFESESNALL